MANKRLFHTPLVPPFVIQGDGMAPALGDDVRVHPALPILRTAQDFNMALPSYIVIEAGEPVGIWEDTSGKKWLVPASPTRYTLTYGATDIGNVEDLDVAGSMVAATGATTAYIEATLLIGVANQAIRQNPKLTTGEAVYENYNTTFKEVVIRRRHFLIPYRRRGVNALGRVVEGDLVACGAIYGNTLSASNRPKLIPARMSQSAVTAATQGTIVGTPVHANLAAGDQFRITVAGVSCDFYWDGSETETAFVKNVAKGANLAEDIDNLVTAFEAAAISGRATITDGTTTFTVTARNYGPIPIQSAGPDWTSYVEVVDAAAGMSAVVTAGTSGAGAIHADEQIDNMHLGTVMGRVIRVWNGSSIAGTGHPMVGTYDLSKVVTPRNSGLGGTDTGGTPNALYVLGNTFEGAQVPTDWTYAGALLITLEL